MANRIPILALLGLLSIVGLWGCSEEHTPLELTHFPAPLLDATITGDETLELSWEWDDKSTDWYMIYLCAFALDEDSSVVEVCELVDSTETSPRSLFIENLTSYDEELGDTLYRFLFFRVAPKTEDTEGLRSPAAFPHR